jgi:hypothetical protein
MERMLWKSSFTIGDLPDWPCPTCSKGTLRIKDGSFFKAQPLRSREAGAHEDWDPEWITYVYSCLLICANDKCGEVVSSSGTGSVQHDPYEDNDGEWTWDTVDQFQPRFFEPPLALIEVPTTCPEAVRIPLWEAFRLLFAAPGAAANSIRIAIEALLTELGVKRFRVAKGKRRFVMLHERIELLTSKHSGLKEPLLAIKWLGNAGSHADSADRALTADDVLDALELTEHILHEIFASRRARLAKLAKKVNNKRGSAR